MRHSISTLGRAALVAAFTIVAVACSNEGANPLEAPCVVVETDEGLPLLGADCDPMVPTQCGFPFPSNVFLRDDPTTPTGKRVAFGASTLPRAAGQDPISPELFGDSDGFSAGQPALVHLPGATTLGLPTQDTIPLSLTDESPTLLIDAETGERIPHFSEIDRSIENEEDADRTLMIRPVVRLRDATRYIVAIRRVVDASGSVIPPSETFRALRDGTKGCDVSVERRRALYEDIFGRLKNAGIEKDDLQIAWDYTTASRENNTRWLLHMRDDALAKVGDLGPMYTIEEVEEDPNPYIRRRILAKMTVPLYLDSPDPGGKLVFDDNGLPKQSGTADYQVIIHIPNAATKGTPGGLIQNGHGLLGYMTEGQDGYLAEFADGYNYVAFSVELIGMAHDDVSTITDSIVTDMRGFRAAVDRQHQGILNSLLAMRMMAGRFASEPLAQFEGKSAIDTAVRHYRGDSQGGIFGGTYMALSTDVTRGLLSVPGMPYSLLLSRSSDFGLYFVLLRSAYQTGRNIQLLLGAVQMVWDRTEPNGYMPYINDNMLKGTPKHEVLLHVAIGDHQVAPLGAHIMARAVFAKNLAPVNRSVWGIPEDPGPITTSAMVEYSFGLPESPKTNTPPDSTLGEDPHGKVRNLGPSFMQANEFFRTGVIKAFCDGPCDPE